MKLEREIILLLEFWHAQNKAAIFHLNPGSPTYFRCCFHGKFFIVWVSMLETLIILSVVHSGTIRIKSI
jgi:hypothetical protein